MTYELSNGCSFRRTCGQVACQIWWDISACPVLPSHLSHPSIIQYLWPLQSPSISSVSLVASVRSFFSDVTMLRGPGQLEHLKCLDCDHPWISHEALEILEGDRLYVHRQHGLPDHQCGSFYPQEPAVSALYEFSKPFGSPDKHARPSSSLTGMRTPSVFVVANGWHTSPTMLSASFSDLSTLL